MKIKVKAKPNARHEKVEILGDGSYKISVREPAQNGLANNAVCRAVAGHFNVAPARVRILRGGSSRNKTVEII